MILFGYPIHRKHTNKVKKILVAIVAIIVFLLLISCSKIEFNNFDPTTSTLRYIITKDTKWKQ
mgnify:FL=1|jgi:hypothetical protein|tara:strand:- start:320 stop:508 length:189 start_codon:yes stop_codon:yes gene_type:complete